MSIDGEGIPRYAEPVMDDNLTCGDCAYYRDVYSPQKANGVTHYIGICIFQIFQADTFEELEKAEPVEVEPVEEACVDFRGTE